MLKSRKDAHGMRLFKFCFCVSASFFNHVKEPKVSWAITPNFFIREIINNLNTDY